MVMIDDHAAIQLAFDQAMPSFPSPGSLSHSATDEDDLLDLDSSRADLDSKDALSFDRPKPTHRSSKTGIRQGPEAAEKRATHNATERARRESLNGRFMTLAQVLPTMPKSKRPSKNMIVNKALEYVRDSQINERTLVAENTQLRREVEELRQQLRAASTAMQASANAVPSSVEHAAPASGPPVLAGSHAPAMTGLSADASLHLPSLASAAPSVASTHDSPAVPSPTTSVSSASPHSSTVNLGPTQHPQQNRSAEPQATAAYTHTPGTAKSPSEYFESAMAMNPFAFATSNGDGFMHIGATMAPTSFISPQQAAFLAAQVNARPYGTPLDARAFAHVGFNNVPAMFPA